MMKKDGEVASVIMKTTTCLEGHMANKELHNKRESIQFEFKLD
jgi:hypothetical protein